MYNFHISTLLDDSSGTFVLDEHVEVSGHAIRYLKKFQLSAISFLYNHLKNQEFCILNDERGLGKTATSSVLFGITATQKNCFIVVENNDDRVIDWQFHLDVLTDLNVRVLNEEKDYNETIDSIYIVKWNTLRLIEDLSKWRIDMVVIDNREQLLNNAFCISTLLKNFEKKIQLVISGIDITSDVKLLFNILRLGGRLERQLETFKEFDEKFHLPDQNAISNKNSDLEEYYRKREMMKDYCRDYRLRRYRYQYENLLPLVDPQRYRAHLVDWKATKRVKNNAESIIVSESISTVISTEDLLEKLNSQENHIQSLDGGLQQTTNINSMMVNREKCVQLDSNNTPNDANDEDANMSPLIYNSESDSEQEVVLISSNSIESVIPIVDLDDDDDVEEIAPNTSKVQDNEKRKENVEFSIQNSVKETKKSSKKSQEQTGKTPQDKCLEHVIPDGITIDEVELRPKRDMEINKENPKAKRSTKEEKIQDTCSSTETFIESDQDSRTQRPSYKKHLKGNNNNRSPDGHSAKSGRKISMKKFSGIHNRETRNMKRITRSSGGKCFALEFEPDKKPKTKITSKTSRSVKVPAKEKISTEAKRARNPEIEKKKAENPKPMTPKTKNSSDHPTISQNLLPPSSDSEEIQCGQRLNIESSVENVAELIKKKSNTFLFPRTPPSLSILPIAGLLGNDSDVILLSNNNEKTMEEISLLSGSNDEPMTVRRTRKRQGKYPSKKNLNKFSKAQKTNSPDLFSLGSDNGINTIPFTHVHCNVPIPTTSISNNTFGFKIFGSEVRRPTENITTSASANTKSSCLNMLDQMCEKLNETSSSNGIKYALRKQKLSTDRQSFNESSNLLFTSIKPNIKERNQHTTYTEMPMPSHTQPITLSTDDIFEITNNATFGSTLRINSTGDISPVQQLNSSQHQHHNKITNYLIGSGNAKQTDDDPHSFGTPSKRTAIIQQLNVPGTRKSPKSLKSTQTTKLTKWFRRSFLDDTTQQQHHQQQLQPAKESAEASTFSKKTKRRRLDLLFNS